MCALVSVMPFLVAVSVHAALLSFVFAVNSWTVVIMLTLLTPNFRNAMSFRPVGWLPTSKESIFFELQWVIALGYPLTLWKRLNCAKIMPTNYQKLFCNYVVILYRFLFVERIMFCNISAMDFFMCALVKIYKYLCVIFTYIINNFV